MTLGTLEGFQLSPHQRRSWTLSRDGRSCRIRAALLVEGPIESAGLRSSFGEALGRHEIWRTRYPRLAGLEFPIQVIGDLPRWEYLTSELPAGGLAGSALADRVERWLDEDPPDEFDPEEGPVLRVTLSALSAERHLLLLDASALSADGQSLRNLMAEVVAIYGGRGGEAEEAIQYADFAEWQNELLGSDDAHEGLEYWREPLAAACSAPPLPMGGDRRSGEVSRVGTELGAGRARAVERAARRFELSVEELTLGAWLVLLWRYLRESPLGLGRFHPGRRFEDLEKAQGSFARYLPVALALQANDGFGDVAERVATALRESEEWHDYFTWGDPPAALEEGFFFRYGFQFYELAAELRARDSRFVWIGERARFDRCELALEARRSAEGLCLEIHHHGSHAHDAGRLLDQLVTLLESALAAPEAAISELEILSASERRQLLSEWQGEKLEAGGPLLLHRLFEARVERSPSATALLAFGEELSFRELDRRSNRLARRLRRRGMGPESRVVLFLERSAWQIVGILAALKAGAAFVPIDPNQPRRRLESMLGELAVGAPGLVLTVGRLSERLPAANLSILVLDEVGDRRETEDDGVLDVEPSPDNLAYLIFTSGTTGRPKGTMIRHRSAVNLLEALGRAVHGESPAPRRVAVNAPLSFDASIKQFLQLLAGHTLVLVPEDVRPDGEALRGFLAESGAEVLDCTPSQLRILLRAGLGKGEGGRFERVLVGGEAIDRELWAALSKLERPRFFNVYGPTECTVDSTAQAIGPESVSPSLGRPLANVKVHLLDAGGRLVSVGMPGEISIGGEGLARGYLGRPRLTAEKFIPSEFCGVPGARLYRSGDRGRRRADGRLEYLGRADHQVKIRGVRLELGEIEAILGEYPGVGEAVVVLRETGAGDGRLVAYATPKREVGFPGGQLRHRLPDGQTVAVLDRIGTDYVYQEIFEDRCYVRRGIELPEDAVVFDVGANVGLFTLFVDREAPHSRIYAFEPLAPIFEALRYNARRARAEVRLFPHGLGRSESEESFTYYPNYTARSGLAAYADPVDEAETIRRFTANQAERGLADAGELLGELDELLAGKFEAEEQKCRLRRLSDVLREEEIERIDLLKIDVQRAELDVLRGIDLEDWPKIAQVVMEIHDLPGADGRGRVDEIVALLENRGFEVIAEQDELLRGTDRHNLYARRPELAGRRSRNGAPIPASPALEQELEELSSAALLEHLREHLPEVMVPAGVVVLESFPYTRHGKVDRTALPVPEDVETADEGEALGPRTPVEEILAGLWAEVLGLDTVDVRQSFFELGGHSLLATQLISRIREAFGVEVPLRALFEAPSVEDFGAKVESALRSGEAPAVPPLEPMPRKGEIPLSFAQQRLWFLQQFDPESSVYNNPKTIPIEGAVDVPLMAEILSEVVRRHEVLRTVLPKVDGEPVQKILPATAVGLPRVDLASLAPAERSAQAELLSARIGALPFRLERETPLRLALLHLASDEHLLVFVLHHAASDGWSLGVLEREVAALHTAFSQGLPSPLPDLEVQYADYAIWQRRWLAGEVLEAEIAHWRQRLAGAPPLLELPTDRPRPAAVSHRGAARPLRLPRALTSSLTALSQRRGTTLFMTLLAGYQALLSRWSGQLDVSVGTPIAGRHHLETENLIGFFVNTLVLRTRLDDDPDCLSLLARVREATLEAHAHQDLPFEKLVEELHPQRSLSHSPLFQVAMVFQNAVSRRGGDPERSLGPIDPAAWVTKFEMALVLGEAGDSLAGIWQYDRDLYDASTVARLAGRLEALLAAMAERPEERLSRLELLRPAERHQMVLEWNDTAVVGKRSAQVAGLVEMRARQMPDALALSFDRQSLSYGELNARANRLAHHLLRLGVGPESRVGLCFDRSSELVTAVLAVWKAGGCYVPLDPDYPAERLEFLVSDADVAIVVSPGRLRQAFVPPGVPVVELDARAAEIASESAADPASAVRPAELAYAIYTSGSTGEPKGVMVSYRGLVNLATAQSEALGLGPGDRLLQFARFSFDASIWEIAVSWAAGACLAMAPAESLLPGEALEGLLRERRVTAAALIPTVLASIEDDLPALRTLVVAGEACPRELAERWARGRRIYDIYGPTEITVSATTGLYGGWGPPAIGRPIPGMRVLLLDRRHRLAAIGTPGEIFIGGVGLARGYLARPGLTAERFVPDTFGISAGGRLYRTGDLARSRSDGSLEVLGRADHQVKVRGFRIELGEIEAVLAGVAGVREAVVVVREGASGDRRLLACVVPEGSVEPSPPAWREALETTLPEYMIPSVFAIFDSLPLTANRKVDRAALGRAALPGIEGEAAPAAPRTPTEEILRDIWAEVLERESVGVDEDFFALGGHSLLAMRVVSRVRRLLRAEVPVRALFEAPTVAGLAAVVEADLRGERHAEAPPFERAERGGDLPLSFAQERLWFLDQLEASSSAYNIPTALRFERELDPALLAAAFSALAERHEPLRTSFPAVGGEPVQSIAPPAPLPLPVIDLERLGGADRETWARRLTAAEAARPFNLARGPVLRTALLRLGRGDWVLWVTLHHIAGDGWSMGILTREISALYEAFAAGRPSPLEELDVQYADYAVWQRRWLAGAVLEAEVEYWRRELAGAPPLLELPIDRPRPAVQSYHGASHPLRLPEALSSSLTAWCRRRGATVFMALLAGFQASLSRWSGQLDVSVGTPIAGRHRFETEGLIGLFLNTLVLRTHLEDDPDGLSLLERVRETTLEAHAHQELPFEKLVEELEPERSLSYSPLFQAMLMVQNTPLAEGGSLAGRPVFALAERTAKFDLTLTMAQTPVGLAGSLSYARALFDPTTILRMSRQLELLLAGLAETPERRVSELPLLTAGERHQLAAEWNDTARHPGEMLSVHLWVERRARETPDAIALASGERLLSYGGLELAAERLAGRLRAAGVGPEVVVGVLLERSPEMVVAVYAVLKAGGAYLPLDPAYPTERLRFYVEDAAPRWVLTRGKLAGLLPASRAVWRLDQPASAPGSTTSDLPTPAAGPDNLAYVIYTSGSTGRPKGIQIAHRGVVNFLRAMAVRPGLGAGDTLLAVTTLAFDISVLELFLPLAVGGRIALAEPAAASDGEELAAELDRSWATAMQATPITWQILTASGWPGRAGLKILCGGERLPAELAARLGGLGAEVWNLYGPTETTIWSTLSPVRPGPVSLGRPLANTRVYVLGRRLRPRPVGVAGELHVGGAGVSRGYRGRPASTAERFRPDPFGVGPGQRLYATGDLVRARRGGDLEFLGRIDHQVKLRGFRIELGEIEAALTRHPGVREAVVVLREEASGDHRLVAWVVPESGRPPSPGELRATLLETLPEHMVPAVFADIEAFPLTANRKIDRAALARNAPSREALASEVGRKVPRTVAEEILQGIFSQVLGRDDVAIDANFFALGGHSLLATQVLSRVRRAFRVELPVRALFEVPTVAGLATEVERGRRGGLDAEAPPLVRADRSADPPLSFAQQRLWFINQLEPGSSAYNLPSALRLERALEPAVLAAAFGELVRRHETLRTCFPAVAGEPVQRISAPAPVALPVVDLHRLAPVAREAETRRLAAAEAGRPFDLARGPVLRAGLLRLGAEDWILLVTLHHIASDGWSMAILGREVLALYDAFAQGRPSPLEELEIQYADYAIWQRRWLSGEVLEAEVDYWRRQLEGSPPALELPADRPRPAVPSYRGGTLSLAVRASIAAGLAAVARRRGATAFMVVLALFQTLLSRLTGRDDVAVGIPTAARNRLEIEGLIGFFVNTLVLRADLRGDPSFGDLLAEVRERVLEAQAHQDLPFEKLVEELEPERRLSHSPLFQVMLAFQADTAGGRGESAEAPPPAIGPGEVGAKFELTLTVAESAGAFRLSARYRRELFDPTTIGRWLGHLRRLMHSVSADSGQRLSELSLLSPAQRHQVVAEWQGGGSPRRADRVPDRIARRARESPDAVALVGESGSLSYGELLRRSRRLATRLESAGVGPEIRVALFCERDLSAVVALFGIFEAGGAYVPLDLEQPAARLEFLLADSGATLVLSESAWAGRLPEVSIPVWELDTVWAPPGAPSPGEGADGHLSGRQGELAYQLYTSGSTGRPKGVEVGHGALDAYLEAAVERLGLEEVSSFALVSPLTADLGHTMLFPSLALGGCLHLLARERTLDGESFGSHLASRRIECLKIVPSHLAALTLGPGGAEALPARKLILGGELASWSRVEAWRASAADLEIYNHYGPTETTVGVVAGAVEGPALGASVPVGRPLATSTAYLLDRRLGVLAPGVSGELVLGGRQLARSYAGNARATAERFVPDVLSGAFGARLYRTGDRARFRSDGRLEILGRFDHQVKVRGVRIELGEVESVLAGHPGVARCAVVLRGGGSGTALGESPSLVAFIVREPKLAPARAELREYARAHLPEAMVPARFAVLDELPLTANGKIDRRRLAVRPLSDGGESSAPSEEPMATPVEELLAGIWSRVLGVVSISRGESFFDLGGHSLLATQVIARSRAAFGVDLPLRDLFEAPTLIELSRRIERRLRSGQAPSSDLAEPLVPRERSPEGAPLSFGQERLWFLQQLEPSSSAYNVPIVHRLEGELDVAALEAALAEVVRRHEILRTRFAFREGVPRQTVEPTFESRLPIVDLGAIDAAQRIASSRALISKEGGRPFDLAAGPPLRVYLLRLSARDHVILGHCHHAIFDGGSRSIFLEELVALYRQETEGVRAELKALPIQYADYAVWQRRWLSGEVLEAEIEYWRRRLEGAPPVLELPADRPRPAVRSYRGVPRSLRLPADLAEALTALARQRGVTLFMVLLTGFQALLHRWSGQPDICVGTPIAGRGRLEIEGLIGFFVNTLVLRTRFGDDPDFLSVLARVRETTLEAHAHQDLPFEKLVEELQPERSLSHSPLFQVMFSLQNTPRGDAPGGRVQAGEAATPMRDAKFDLNLALVEGSEGLRGSLSYASDLFDETTVTRLSMAFERLLGEIAASPEPPISELPLLGRAEEHQLHLEWNDPAPRPESTRWHELFAAQAEARPDAVAVAIEGQSLSYGELGRTAHRLADHLRSRGVGLGDLVGVPAERSLEMVVAVTATFETGAAYLPMDPAYPDERLRFMVKDAAPKCVLTVAPLAERLPPGTAVVALDGALRDGPIDRVSAVRPAAGPDHPAYVIYTSGSTGRPKGVVVSRRALGAYVGAAIERLGLEACSSFGLVSTPAADLGHTVLFPSLALGGRLQLIPRELTLDAEAFGAHLASRRVEVLKIVPSHLAALVAGTREAEALPTRTLVLGGELSAWALLGELRSRAPELEIYNHYGPTETTVGVAAGRLPVRPVGSSVPIGRPLGGNTVHLVDRHLRSVPLGASGELVVGGAQLAQGYRGDGCSTAERFVPDGFSGLPGARLYRTGDRARRHGDGSLEILGRIDHQVKVRGFRIELREIEAALLRHEAVREAVVVVPETAPRAPILAVYAVPEGPATLDVDALRSALRASLPEYMVPSAFVILDALPLSATGKVDRAELTRRPLPAAEGEEGSVAPRTPSEEILGGIFSEVLGRESVGIEEDFFELGGHSLLATRVISRVRKAFGLEVPVRAIFEEPTVARLAAAIDRRLIGDRGPQAPPLERASREDGLPLSFAQQRLWFIDQLEPGSSAYNVPSVLRFERALDPAVLAAAFGEVVRRHEILRTSFPSLGGEPVQAIAPSAPVLLPVIDLGGLPRPGRESEARRLTAAEAARPFDLERGPVLRASLIRMENAGWVLLTTLHHIASDGWSRGILEREVSALYEAFAAGLPSPLEELEIQYADYAIWQRRWLSGEALEAEIDHWRRQLEGAPPMLELPTDRPRPAVSRHRGASYRQRFPERLSRALGALGRERGTTLFMTLLAGYQTLLWRSTGQPDISVGTPIAGRNRLEIEGLIGFFVNTLVLRTRFGDDPDVGSLLARVRETTFEAHAHQDLPFERLVEALQPRRTTRHAPLFQVVFVFQNVRHGRETPSDTVLPGAGDATGETTWAAKFELALILGQIGDSLAGIWQYDRDLYDASTVARLAAGLETLLTAMTERPERRASRLELFRAAERHQLLVEWNDTPVPSGPAVQISELFETQAARAGDALAAVFSGQSLSFGELNLRANRLAHHLGHLGIGPGERVGLCLARSLDLVISILAIWKTGGCYVPLDPHYPAERLAFMASDSGVSALVTRSDLPQAFVSPEVRVVELDTRAGEIAACEGANPGMEIRPDEMAYVIYTSGSTGQPKGVMVSHRGLVSHCVSQKEALGFGPDERFLQFASYSFDASIWEITVAWAAGACLYLAPQASLLPGEPLERELRKLAVTVVGLIPTVLAGLSSDLPALRTVMVGGEACPRELAERWAAGRRLYNIYGPTEVTVTATFGRYRGSGPLTLGRPIAQVRIVLLGRDGALVPIGTPGEIFIGGPGVARGYAGRPALTAERFVPDAFGASAGERAYRTGDLARSRPDGGLEFLGRVDHQVKLRGFRIELGEIEAALTRHEAVREAVVTLREEASGDRRLVAHVVPEGEVTPGSRDLRIFLERTLPGHMVPAAFVPLEALPMTSNRKVDRGALPAPEPVSGSGSLAPGTPTEEILCGIWAEVLDRETVGVDDDFFALGGHSLLATRVISRIRRAFEVELPVRALFETPTVAGLKVAIEEGLHAEGGIERPPLERASREGEIPMSFAQQRLWFIDQLDPGSVAYNLPSGLRFEGELHVSALEAAFGEVVNRHESLRTSFRSVDGEPVQTISPPRPQALPLVDLQGLRDVARAEEMRRLASVEASRAFDLAKGPLIRMGLFRLGIAEHVLLLTVHHVTSDGWSMSILAREVITLYQAFSAGRPSPLSELEIQYADYAVWQRRWLSGAALAAEVDFWRRQLGSEPPVLELPYDRPWPERPTHRGARRSLPLSSELSKAVLGLSRAEGVTSFMTLLAVFSLLMSRRSGQSSLIVGMPIAGRGHRELEDLIGFFVNVLPLRIDLDASLCFDRLLGEVRRRSLAVLQHQDLPLDKLVEELRPERRADLSPFFQVTFGAENTPREAAQVPELGIAPFPLGHEAVRFPLTVWALQAGDDLGLRWTFDTDLFDASTIELLHRQFEALLGHALADPRAKIGELEMMSESERESRRLSMEERQESRYRKLKSFKPKGLKIT